MTQKELLQIQSVIDKVQTMVDGGLKITIQTNEMNPEDSASLFGMKGKAGWMLFKPSIIKEEDIIDVPEEVTEFKKDKTPSQRLRAVLYILWEQRKKEEDFDTYYKRRMNILIEKLKENIDQ
jgi:hypothetical protein